MGLTDLLGGNILTGLFGSDGLVGGVTSVLKDVGIIKDPEMELKVKQALMDYELKVKDSETKIEEMILKDMASARNREIEINKTDTSWLTKNITSLLAVSCLGLSFILFYQVFWVGVSPDKKEVLIYILGVLSSIDTAIVSYYFGSSKGSSDKSNTINGLHKHIMEK